MVYDIINILVKKGLEAPFCGVQYKRVDLNALTSPLRTTCNFQLFQL